MILFAIFAAGALLAGAAYFYRMRRAAVDTPAAPRTQRSSKRPSSPSSSRASAATARTAELKAPPFAAVEIRPGPAACASARALAGQRFLASRAPLLPLRDCGEPHCRCAFRKLSDRRLESRRWGDDGITPRLFTAAERREMRDRRSVEDD